MSWSKGVLAEGSRYPDVCVRHVRTTCTNHRPGPKHPGAACRSASPSLGYVDRVHEIRHDQQQAEPDQQGEYPDTEREKLAHVHQSRVRPAPDAGDPGPDLLVDDDGQVAAVQGEQWQQVEQA